MHLLRHRSDPNVASDMLFKSSFGFMRRYHTYICMLLRTRQAPSSSVGAAASEQQQQSNSSRAAATEQLQQQRSSSSSSSVSSGATATKQACYFIALRSPLGLLEGTSICRSKIGLKGLRSRVAREVGGIIGTSPLDPKPN